MEQVSGLSFEEKEILIFRNPKIVIEGTEFGDVIMTSGVNV